MKRSVVIGVTALVAGLLLAITAFAAPFRDYDRAAGDQYTTTTPTSTTTTPGTTVTVGQTVTIDSAVAGAGSPTVPVGATTPVSGQGGPTTVEDEGAGVAPDDDEGDGTPGEDDGSGAAPDEDSGAGAPLGGGTGGGTGAGVGRGADRIRIAFLSIGVPFLKLSTSVVHVIGIPQWSGVVGLDVDDLDAAAAGTVFAGIGTSGLDLGKLRGFAKRLGSNTVPAVGLSPGLPDLLTHFEGSVEPIAGLVIARKRLRDADDRALAEAFQRSFARGAVLADIPVVGVELTDSDPSSIAYFKKIKGASSIDNIDTPAGQASLARLISGAKPGHYGTQSSATAAQPPTISPAATSDRVIDGGGSLSGSPLLVGLLLTMALLGGRALVTVMQRSRA